MEIREFYLWLQEAEMRNLIKRTENMNDIRMALHGENEAYQNHINRVNFTIEQHYGVHPPSKQEVKNNINQLAGFLG